MVLTSTQFQRKMYQYRFHVGSAPEAGSHDNDLSGGSMKRKICMILVGLAVSAGMTWAGIQEKNPGDFPTTLNWCQLGCAGNSFLFPDHHKLVPTWLCRHILIVPDPHCVGFIGSRHGVGRAIWNRSEFPDFPAG